MALHFSLHELQYSSTATKKGITNVANIEQKQNLIKLASVLEIIRYNTGPNKPIKVNSAFRCPELNKLVGGVEHSRHLEGKAADIYIPHCDPRIVHALLINLKNNGYLRYWYQISPFNYHVDIH